jgi:Na+-transporting NADH:ubiquinone oxidoreductase subunit A
MTGVIKIRKGFDINLAGKADRQLGQTAQPETFALKPGDFHGISRPKVLVAEGDNVEAGTPLMIDKAQERVQYCAPVSGEVVEIRRGDKRKLLEIRILADREVVHKKFKKYTLSDLVKLNREDAEEQMLASGVWPNIVQRPFGLTANPAESPKAIFISAFDTHPLAPDYDFLFEGQEHFFEAGITVLKKFTSGAVHLSLNGGGEVSKVFAHASDVTIHKFAGPHPAGNVGTHIHFIDPIAKGDVVWTVHPYGVIQIGKLFHEGIYDASRRIALVGSGVQAPRYYQTYTGARIDKIVEGKVKDGELRYISGNVLTGNSIGKDGYLGFFDHMITVIPEGRHHELLGWLSISPNKLSYHRAFGLLSFLNSKKKEYVVDTNTYGEHRPFVVSGVFERVTPLDILPTHLLKSIQAEDYDEMESLGIYEVLEEDLALCEFVDPSKHDVQALLREGLDLIRQS